MSQRPASDPTNPVSKISRGDELAQGRDLAAENRRKLAELFPEVLIETPEGMAVDAAVLGQLVGVVADDDRRERFGLSWHGKSAARRLALTPSTGTLRPAFAESVDWDTTQNVLIEGDNLEVLKLLQKAYAGQAKLIYIDPPYNTGSDFIYEDDFSDPIGHYHKMIGVTDVTGIRLTSNPESSGRFHTGWLNMIQPRLLLAREMLRADGVIIVSVDDVEMAHLKVLLDEIFGRENALAALVWDRNRKNDARFFSVGHEYMLVYARSKQALVDQDIKFRGDKEGVDSLREEFDRLRKLHHDDWSEVQRGIREYLAAIPDDSDQAPLKRFNKVDKDGPFRDDGNINWPGGNGPTYEVLHPVTKKPCKLPTSGWRYPTPKRFWEEVDAGRIVFGDDETTVPRVRTNIFKNRDQVMPSVHYSYAQTASNEFVALFEGQRPFENPKPVKDLTRLVGYLTEGDDLIIDFFAGSGTTGHATMSQNDFDDGSRKFLLVQLPEPTDRNDYKTIADLTADRLRRAGRKIQAERSEKLTSASAKLKPLDTGFRVFKLDTANVRAWEAPTTDALQPQTIEQLIQGNVEAVRPDRTDADLLWGAMSNLGLPLDGKVVTREIDGKTVYFAGGGTLQSCFAQSLDLASGERLAAGLAQATRDMGVAGEVTVLVRDSAFGGIDAAKVNLVENLKQRMPEGATARVRSI